MKKLFAHSIVLLICTVSLYGQDAHFSQFNEHSALINPALTGADGPLRITAGFKDQWQHITTPYRTYGIALETRLKPGNWEQAGKLRNMTFKQRSLNRLAAGFSIYKDKAGDGNLDLTQANASLATFVPVSAKSFLSFGVQASIAQRQLNNAALIFPNQFGGTGYDSGIPSNENFSGQSFTYFDAGAGLVWSYNSSTGKQMNNRRQVKANLGFSAYHITTPKQPYLAGDKNSMRMKYVVYGDFLFRIPGENIAIAPKYLVQLQGASNEILAGFLIKHFTDNPSKYTGLVKSTSFGYGIYYRNKDAIILNILLEWKEQYAVGLSYDINTSRLTRTSSGRGGLEIMLRYTPPKAYSYQVKKKASSGDK